MTKIYVIGYYTGYSSYGIIKEAGRDGDVYGLAFTVGDGYYNIVASHLSSGKYWYEHDMGITSDWKHDEYDKAAHGEEWALINLGVKQNQSDAYGKIMQIVSDTEKEFAEESKDENN